MKQIAQNLTGYWLYKRSHLPRGTDLACDIQREWGRDQLRTVLDVGANAGQFSGPFHDRFPNATIHCFEPVSTTFARLEAAFKGVPRFLCHNLAMGSREGGARIFVNPDDTESSMVAGYGAYHEETVKMTTVDRFCHSHAIERVDFMKTDTEGFELEVLKGASALLADHRIRLLLVETELLPSRRRFVPLAELHGFLDPLGYEVFAIYNQHHHWDGRKSLSFVNALFAARELVEPVRQRLKS